MKDLYVTKRTKFHWKDLKHVINFVDDSMDVILTTQHGFTMTVSVKLDKDGHSYFDADLCRKMSKCYELKAGNKIIVRAPQPGLINIDVYFPNVISRSKSDQD